MAADRVVVMVVVVVVVLVFLRLESAEAQQSYVNNRQLDCNQNDTVTLGFVCNGASPSCTSYLTFRSTSTYNSPATIAYLLSSDASQIAAANNISDINPLPIDTLLIVPINCSCSSSNYYQHDALYTLNSPGETYFSVSNDTYQALTTCQSMEAQNPRYNFRQLVPGLRLNVPLRCACPTRNQTAAGFTYLLTYLIRQGNSVDSISHLFSGAGADVQSILDANQLTPTQLIFFFTPILVPLRTQPTSENTNTLPSPPLPTPPPFIPTTPPAASSGSSRKWVFIGVGIGAGVLVLFASLFVVWLFFRRRRRYQKSPLPPPKLAEESGSRPPLPNYSVLPEDVRGAIETLTVYKFEELEKATASFAVSNRINNGSSSVYLGSFKGDNAVVKIMKGDVSREIDVLRQINHSHILRLSGFCLHQGITYLVYEYAEKGSLTDWLLPDQQPDGVVITKVKECGEEKRLDWKQRLQIAYDVADALNYLHNFTNPPYIHKNLKSSNILLDANMRAKVANFGLARTLEDQSIMTRHVVGTYGYMAPEYIENGLITPKLDVFAFGVVMLELLSGREAIFNKVAMLSESIQTVLNGENVREKLQEFMDPCLGEEYPLELAYSMAQLARRCVAHNLDARPPVSELFMVLSKLLSTSLDWDPSYELNHSTSFSLSD